MADVKAAAVVFIRDRLREMGDEAEQRLITALPESTAEQYETILPVSWLPVEVARTIYEQAVSILYPNTRHPLRQLGYDVAVETYTGLYRMVLRIVTLPSLLERVARIWRNHHNAGQMVAERIEHQIVLLTVTDYPTLPESIREVIAGYMLALCELTGAKNISVKRVDKPPTWRWSIQWGG